MSAAPSRFVVLAVFVALTLVWGSTWAVIRVSLEGFPPFLGGAMRYVRARGAADVVASMKRIGDAADVRSRSGARLRFEVCELLAELARG